MIEYDAFDRPVDRVLKVEPRTGCAVNPDWFEVRCYRDGRHSGSTPYDYARAAACVRRLLGDGWRVSDPYTLQFIAKLGIG